MCARRLVADRVVFLRSVAVERIAAGRDAAMLAPTGLTVVARALALDGHARESGDSDAVVVDLISADGPPESLARALLLAQALNAEVPTAARGGRSSRRGRHACRQHLHAAAVAGHRLSRGDEEAAELGLGIVGVDAQAVPILVDLALRQGPTTAAVEVDRSFKAGRGAQPRELAEPGVEQRGAHDAVAVHADLVGRRQDLPDALEIKLDAGHVPMGVAVRKVLQREIDRAPRRLPDALRLAKRNLRVVDPAVDG